MLGILGSILLAAGLLWGSAGSRSDSAAESPASSTPSAGRGEYALADTCTESLQARIDAAAPGDIVRAASCIYREGVVITKPLTLQGGRGSEIRGSDVWAGWTRRGGYWTRGTLPPFSAGDARCEPGTSRCLRPAQVFLDGEPLEQVLSEPASGQFAVDSDRNVVLADDPTGHTVEVAVRRQWVSGQSDDVVVRGFVMKHAANGRGIGAITNRNPEGGNYYSGWTVEENALSDAHAAVVRIGGRDFELLRNDISRGGQLGVQGSGENILVQGNRVYDNNTEDFLQGWAAGGMKFATRVRSLSVEDNEVFENRGVGVWCDLGCRDVTYTGNRVHHNWGPGLHFEVSTGAEIFSNTVWENGWRYHTPSRQWAPGIKVANSSDVEVYANILAWNASGITALHHTRREPPLQPDMENVYIHDNVIVAGDGPSLSWVQERGWARGMVERASAGNRGAGNRYWYGAPEDAGYRFRWAETDLAGLAEFNATPGERGGRYIGDEEKEAVIASAKVPSAPEPHEAAREETRVLEVLRTFLRAIFT